MDKYIYKKQEPKVLPNRIVLSDGNTRTDRSTFTKAEIIDAGYVLYQGEKPSVDGRFEYVRWTGTDYEVLEYSLEYVQSKLLEEVSNQFEEMFKNGTFESSVGITVDNRRYGSKNDKDNVQTMIEEMEDLGLAAAPFTDSSGEQHLLTLEQWNMIKSEMRKDGLSKYQWKWEEEDRIKNSTLEELKAVDE